MREYESAIRSDLEKLDIGLRHEMKELDIGLRHEMKDVDTGLRHEIKELELRMTIKLGSIVIAGLGILTLIFKFL